MIKPTLDLDPQLPRHPSEQSQKPEYRNIAGLTPFFPVKQA
jgi:hypothetical protein